MKLYFSGLGGAQKFIIDFVKTFPHPRALASYYYKDQLDKLLRRGITSIFLDCGAYSAMNTGAVIDIDDFVDFCKERFEDVDAIASLDVIGDAEESFRNYLYILKRGVDAWPTYHFGEPEKYLLAYVKETDHICVGGVAGAGIHKDSILRNLQYIYAKYPSLKIHVFGVNSFDVLMALPIYSVDALTWRSGSRFGDVFVRGRRYKVGRKRIGDTGVYKEVVAWLLKNAGLDLKDPDFNWNMLDLYNLKYLYDMLEVEHAQKSFSSLVLSEPLF